MIIMLHDLIIVMSQIFTYDIERMHGLLSDRPFVCYLCILIGLCSDKEVILRNVNEFINLLFYNNIFYFCV